MSRFTDDIALMQALARLDAIEAEMRRIGLWGDTAPDPDALASVMPFCYDTLLFHEWLQWVFLPRMREVFQRGESLPAACVIHPLAEHSFAELPHPTDALLALIDQFDRFMA
ncbi:MAG: YqcC family protein [Halothiobacillaceae bacterium]|jgi:uncharacterized protein YqcC (DUF446 family)|nr:YqcC family protein [Halothiobacillaceae bacterium]